MAPAAAAQQGRPEDVFRDVFGDVFSEFFGGQQRQNARRPGARRRPALRLRDHASKKPSTASRPRSRCRPPEACEPCNGTGAEPGTQPETCTTCQGHGRVRVSQGFFTMERTCGRCQGSGQVIKTPCRTVRRPWRRAQGSHAQRHHSRRHRRRPAHPPLRRRRAGHEERPEGRPLHLRLGDASTTSSSATARRCSPARPCRCATAALGGEIEMPTIDGGKHARLDPRRRADRQAHAPQEQGHAQPARRRQWRHGGRTLRRDAHPPHRQAERTAPAVRQECCPSGKCHPESQGFFKKVKKFFEEDTRA